ncbi:hypothetical protein Goari_013352 [Gossypium aridum]|uniref:Uncharacterized protein n=1 Tax=Gossypium aridum TaxID=34290 RepID=A0A7J8XEI5_GOSAI|nr:hypothetical protein [Gossypium aridum]
MERVPFCGRSVDMHHGPPFCHRSGFQEGCTRR